MNEMTTRTRELEYYVDPFGNKEQIMYVVVSETYAGHGYPDAVFDYKEDAEEYKEYREKEQQNVNPTFYRYFKVVRVVKNPRSHLRTP